MRKFMFAAVSAMVIVCVSNVFANQSAMQFDATTETVEAPADSAVAQ